MNKELEKEIKAELRAERYQALFRRYKLLIIALVIIVFLVIGIWQFVVWRKNRSLEQASTHYFNIVQLLNTIDGQPVSSASKTQALAELEKHTSQFPQSIKTLAQFEQANLLKEQSKRQEALKLWTQISKDLSVRPEFRSLAELFWIQNQLDDVKSEQLRGKISELLGQQTPWNSLIKECEALLDLKTGNAQKATQIFGQLSSDPNVSPGVQQRARMLMQIIAMKKIIQ